jgi:hypothetical protein
VNDGDDGDVVRQQKLGWQTPSQEGQQLKSFSWLES